MQGGKTPSIPVMEVSGQPQDLLYYYSSESLDQLSEVSTSVAYL
jgi:hypothetical protein